MVGMGCRSSRGDGQDPGQRVISSTLGPTKLSDAGEGEGLLYPYNTHHPHRLQACSF